MKSWYQSKTVWVNILAVAGSIALTYGLDPSRWAEISMAVLAVANIALRLITGEPIGLHDDSAPKP